VQKFGTKPVSKTNIAIQAPILHQDVIYKMGKFPLTFLIIAVSIVALLCPYLGAKFRPPKLLKVLLHKQLVCSNQRFWQTKFLEPKFEHQDTNPSISGTSRFDVPNIRSHGTALQERLQGREFGSLDLKEAQKLLVAGPSLCQEVWSPTTVRAFVFKIVDVSIFCFSILPQDPSHQHRP